MPHYQVLVSSGAAHFYYCCGLVLLISASSRCLSFFPYSCWACHAFMYNSLWPSPLACCSCCSCAMAYSSPCLYIWSSYFFCVFYWCCSNCRSNICWSRSFFCRLTLRCFISRAWSGGGASGPNVVAVVLLFFLRSISAYSFFSTSYSSRDFI